MSLRSHGVEDEVPFLGREQSGHLGSEPVGEPALARAASPWWPCGWLTAASALSSRERLWNTWMTCWRQKKLASPQQLKRLLFCVAFSSSAWVDDTSEPSLFKGKGSHHLLLCGTGVQPALPVFTPVYPPSHLSSLYSHSSSWSRVSPAIFLMFTPVFLPIHTFPSSRLSPMFTFVLSSPERQSSVVCFLIPEKKSVLFFK